MSQDISSNKPKILYLTQPVSACYYNAYLSVILVGAVAQIEGESEKKLCIKERFSYEKSLPDEVAGDLQKLGFNIWINDCHFIEGALSCSYRVVPFQSDNEPQIERLNQLGDMVDILNYRKKVFASQAIEFDESASEKNAFKILLAALTPYLFDKLPMQRIVSGSSKKIENPFSQERRYSGYVDPFAARRYEQAWKKDNQL